MRSWGHFVGLLGPKFWKIYRKEGLVRTLLRGKVYRFSHEKAGWDDVARLVGTDEYGNRYYEDFTHHNRNTGRWVEYADYGHWHLTAKKVGPAWHGWLHYSYDDPPRKENFVEPYYRSHKTAVFKTDHPLLSYRNPGHLAHPDREANRKMAYERNWAVWEPPAAGTQRDGKKILSGRRRLTAEDALNESGIDAWDPPTALVEGQERSNTLNAPHRGMPKTSGRMDTQ